MNSEEEYSGLTKVLGIIGGIIGIGLLIFFTCWSSIEPTEYGLKYNIFTKNVDSSYVYPGGRYFLFFTSSFARFPKIAKSIVFGNSPNADAKPLQTRTKEGLSLSMDVSFQYKLDKNLLIELYRLYNIFYEATLIRIARDAILQEAGKFEAPEYWTKRAQIAEIMQKTLVEEFAKAKAGCIGLQILKIELPSAYENQIVLTQVEVQKKKMKEFEQQAALIRSLINIDTSEALRNITIINSSANSQSQIIKQNAISESRKKILSAESEVFSNAMTSLGLSNIEIIQWIYNNWIEQNQNATILLGVNNPIITIRN